MSASSCEFKSHLRHHLPRFADLLVESGDHPLLVRNESASTPAVNNVTFIIPAGKAALRIDSPSPGCSQE
jgi:hypothetical protein